MTDEQRKLSASWAKILGILIETGYNELYAEDVHRINEVIAKEVGIDK